MAYTDVFHSLISFTSLLLVGLLLDDVQHLPLDGFFLEYKSVLVPNEVGVLGVESVLLHATFEQANDVPVIWVLSEAQASAVVHELSEFIRLILAQVIDGGLLLFLLDGCILFGLRSSWKSLPWERALKEIEDDVSDSFQIISSRLLVTEMSVQTGVSGCSGQVLSISEWDVLSVRRLVTFG